MLKMSLDDRFVQKASTANRTLQTANHRQLFACKRNMGSKYTVISNTDEEGGLGTTSSNLIDAGINDSNTGSSSSHEFEYRPVVIAVAAHVNDNENHIHHDADVNDDHDDDDESFVTANTNNNMNMITISPTGQSSGVRFLSLSDTENSSSRLYNSVFRTTLLPDDTIKAYNIIFAENDFAIKLCKFTVFTFVSIWMMFYFVRFMVSTTLYVAWSVF